jgi:hypothetical protein
VVFWAGLSGEKWMAQEGGLAFEAFESEAYDQSEGVHSSEIPFGASAFLLIFSSFSPHFLLFSGHLGSFSVQNG